MPAISGPERNRVTGLDVAIAAHELWNAPGHCGIHCLILFAGSAPSVDELRDLVVRRWGDVDRLAYRLDVPGEGRVPARLRRRVYWTGGAFDVMRRVRGYQLPPATPLRDFVSVLLAEAVPLAEAGWRLSLLSGYDQDQFAILLQMNHGIADGVSAMMLIDRLLRPATPGAGRVLAPPRTIGQAAPGATRGSRSPWPVLRTALRPSKRLPYNRGRSADRFFTWVDMSAEAVAAARRAARPQASATANDVCLAVVAGALRATILDRGDPLPRRLYIGVPLNMRGRDQAANIGNYVSHIRLPLPVRTADQVQRLREISQLTRDGANIKYAAASGNLLGMVARLPLPAALAGIRHMLSASYISTWCTAVPPLSPQLNLLGRPVLGGAGGPPGMVSHGLVFAFCPFRGSYTIGVTADGMHRDFASSVCEALRREVAQFACHRVEPVPVS